MQLEICNGHVSSNAEDCENQPGSYGYGVWNKVRERILELPAAINMTVGDLLFNKRESYLVTFKSHPSKRCESLSW